MGMTRGLVGLLVLGIYGVAIAEGAGEEAMLTVVPSTLKFQKQTIATKSAEQSVTVSNPGKPVTISEIKGDGPFVVGQNCVGNLGEGKSCTIRVAFRPFHHGPRNGEIVVTTERGQRPQSIHVTGRGGFPGFPGGVLIISALYFGALWLVRSELIVEPAWRQLQAQADRVESNVSDELAEKVKGLLEKIRKRVYMFSGNSLVRTLAGWRQLHEIEQKLIVKLPVEDVRVQMELAEQRLRDEKSEVSKVLANNIKDALANNTKDALTAAIAGVPQSSSWEPRSRSLICEANSRLNEAADRDFETMADWYNKTVWLVGAGLLFIVVLAFAFDRALLFLLGGTAGFLSRLTRSLDRENVPTDYGASWSSLFLSPVAGALAGWCAVLLFAIAKKLGLLGSLDISWDAPYESVAMGLAFVFGFSERAFDTILSKMEEKIQSASSSQKTS
jgi:hypothetical protein